MAKNPYSSAARRRGTVAAFLLALGFVVGAARADDAAQPNVQVVDGFRIDQNAVSHAGARTVEDCAALCAATSKCLAFNYNKISHVCGLGPGGPRLTLEPAVTAGIVGDAQFPAASDEPIFMDCSPQESFGGQLLRKQDAESLAECSQSCADEESCVSLVYRESSKSCELLANLAGASRDADAVGGIKHQLAAGRRHNEAQCEAPPSQAQKQVTEKNVVVVYQRCVYKTFEDKLVRTTTIDKSLTDKVFDECAKVLDPLERVVAARTGSRAFARKVTLKIKAEAMRNLIGAMTAGLMQPTPAPK
jgi:hypothetical protein